MSMKNSNDTVGNRTRDLPACNAVPQSTAPPRTPIYIYLAQSFRPHYGPGVDSASNRNEYQEYFPGVKAAGA